MPIDDPSGFGNTSPDWELPEQEPAPAPYQPELPSSQTASSSQMGLPATGIPHLGQTAEPSARGHTLSLPGLPYDVIREVADHLDKPRDIVALGQTARHLRSALGRQGVSSQWEVNAGKVDSFQKMEKYLTEMTGALWNGPTLMLGLGPLNALAGRLDALPQAERRAAFNTLFNAREELPEHQRAPLLTALADRLGALPQAERRAAFNTLFNAREELPEHQRAPLVNALADTLDFLLKNNTGHTS
jgi:hypothetical protein